MKKTAERLLALALALALVMLLSCFSIAEDAQAAERTEADYVFTDYDHSYHLVSFLNGYNVLAFGNAHSVLHMMGAILVQGTYTGGYSNSGFADGENLPPSYVQGLINAPNSVYNSRNHSNVAPLYVGSGNTVATTVVNGQTNYTVNGVRTGNNSTTPVYVSDDFFNFEEAYEVIKADQATMVSRGRVVTPVNGVITVNVGDNVIIESLEGVTAIDIIGDPTAAVNTTINILDGGDVIMPRELFNGSQPQVREQNEAGTALVFNFPNAAEVELPTQNWIGHIIAPDADVSQSSGNYNGCIICDNLYTAAEGHVYNYNTEDTSWDTVFSLEKVWNDGHDADGIRPDYIEVQLLANGQPSGDVVRLTAEDGWYYVWPALPEVDSAGQPIVYTVREVNVPDGYTSEYHAETQTLINTHDYEEIDIRGTKTWAGESAMGSRMRPMYLTVYLYADGEEVARQTIVVTSDETQSYVFENLPKYRGGVEIVYTVHEDAVPGYIGTSSGYDLTNTWGVESIDIFGTKTWNDANDADGLRPASIVIELLADGVVIEEHVTSASHGWTYQFTNLPKTDQHGVEIVYTVREKEVPEGYTATVNGYDIVNDHEQETIDLSGTKTWNDDDNNDGMRPEAITVILLANMEEVDRITVTAEDGWRWTFTDLPRNAGGKPIHYIVHEEPVEGYTVVNDGMNLINNHENETIEIYGTKTWVDDDDNDGLRPESITVYLLQDGVVYRTVTVTEADGWAWLFVDLPRYTDGVEHVYTIMEEPVPGYTTEVVGYDLINTHEVETIDILGHKVWDDDNNNDGVRPSRVTVYLLADGVRTGKYRTTTEEKNWYWLFEDLPVYKDGVEIVYTFEEEPVPGYTGPVITQMTSLPEGYGDVGYELTNTHESETVRISGGKTWDDADNNDGRRPEVIVIRLWKTVASADGTSLVHEELYSQDVTVDGGWTWDFGELPRYENGQEIIYSITEDPVRYYSTQVHGYNVTNTYTPGKVDVCGVKHWNDANDQDGLRPESITINLLANGVVIDKVTVTAADNWAWNFIGLPEYSDGTKVVYTITEEPVPGYETVVDQYDVINNHVPETTEIFGEKIWDDADDQDGLRPERITIRLYQTVNGVTTEVRNAAVTASGGWRWHFVNLPKYENGVEIVYTIAEDPVEGYTSTVEDGVVTNVHVPETTEVSGKKTWDDADDQDGLRPESITINLLANGVVIDSITVTAEDGWAWSFTDLPKYEEGVEIVYTIAEEPVAGYTATVTGYDVTNTYEPERIDVSGYKVWEDDSDRDGLRPDSIVVILLADGEPIDSCVVTAANGWMGSFTNLPRYRDGGVEIVYTVSEEPVPGYVATIEDYIITNTYEYATVDVTGAKTWDDADNRDGKRPSYIMINLLADGRVIRTIRVTEVNDWAWSFTNLPKYRDGGVEIVYTIEEIPVEGYTTTVNGYDVTNSYTPDVTEVSGSKTWDDADDQDGVRPESITINLLANGEVIDTVTVTAADKWSWSFTDLPKYEEGVEIVYTISEEPVEGYTTTVTGYDVTNSYTPETVEVAGSKTWDDADDQDGVRPESITINLLANGELVATETVTAADGWAWSFTDLPKYEGGVEIVYTIEETTVEGYTTTVNGYDVTNSYTPDVTEVSGSKTWDDADDQDGVRPESITINLLANGELIATKTVTAADKWSWSFTNLPKCKDGVEIVYTIEETPVEGYTTTVNGYDVTNSYTPETIEVAGSKTWDDADDRDHKRPESITVRLWGNGIEIDSMTVTAADGWAWSFTDLPKYVAGTIIAYTVTEDAVPEYTAETIGYDIVNTYEPTTTSISGQKYWFGDEEALGRRPESITIRLYADGVEVDSVTVTEADGWAWTFEDLPLNDDGVEIVYTIAEDVVDGYISTVVGYDVYNTYDRTTFSITKVWEGAEGGDIILTLYADGERLDPQPHYERYGQMYIWDDLPLYNDEGDEIVYSATEKYMDGYMTIYSNVGVHSGDSHYVYDGGTIINRSVVSVYVRKVWADLPEGEEAPAITLTLYCNGVPMNRDTPEPDKHGWYKYYNLPTTVNGMPAHYTVREEPMDGYMAIYTTQDGTEVAEASDGMTITNMRIPATGDDTPLLLWCALLAISGAALLLMRRRRA